MESKAISASNLKLKLKLTEAKLGNKLSRVVGWGWVAGSIGNKTISAFNQVEVEVELKLS